MRLKDAIASMQLGKKERKQAEERKLCTIWSEQAEDGPDTVPLPEYPRPQKVRSEWINLNGWWDYGIYSYDGTNKGGIEEPDGKILVPFSPETQRSGVERTLMPGEVLWYRRKIGNLYLPEDKRLILHFGAVDERCTIYWNGEKVGSHRNGYLGFSFDITEYAKIGENELTVYVWDDTDEGQECRGKQSLNPGGMFYHAQSGIWQTVWLEFVPEYYLKHLRITPRLEDGTVEIRMKFSEALVTRNFDSVVTGIMNELTSEEDDEGLLYDQEGKSASSDCDRTSSIKSPEEKSDSEEDRQAAPGEVRITIGGYEESSEIESQTFTFPWNTLMKVQIPISDIRLWSPENPELYSLRIEAGADVVDSYFAMRSFGIGKDGEGKVRLLLNGRPYFFNGILNQGYWPETLMTAPSDEAFVYDITRMKEAGFNTLRMHVKVEAARWYHYCDRIGMVVWQDMVNGGGAISKMLETYLPTVVPAARRMIRDDRYELLARDDVQARKRFEKDLVRMTRQLYNCPCIGMWVPFNEGWGQFDALRLTELVKRSDSTRPVDHASGWFDQGGGDVLSVHNYFRDLKVEKDVLPFIRFRNWGKMEDEMEDEFYQDRQKSSGRTSAKNKKVKERTQGTSDKQGIFGSLLDRISGKTDGVVPEIDEPEILGLKPDEWKEEIPSVEMGWEMRAFVISEYGGANCQIPDHTMSGEVYGYSNVTAEEFPAAFEETLNNVRALEAEGLSGAVYTQVSDIEEETNGLMTYDRKVTKTERGNL